MSFNSGALLWLTTASISFHGCWDVRWPCGRLARTHSGSWLAGGVPVNLMLLGYFKSASPDTAFTDALHLRWSAVAGLPQAIGRALAAGRIRTALPHHSALEQPCAS